MQPQEKASAARQILVVEDEEGVRSVLKEIVENLDCKVLEAKNVKEAMAHLEKWSVDLMLLDLHLGGANGIDLLRVLHRRNWRVPTVVVSAYISAETAKELVDLGVLGMVSKPFKMDRIVSEIQRILPKQSG